MSSGTLPAPPPGEPVFLVDAFALIFRAYFAFASRPLKTPDGRPFSAVYGFFKTLFSLVRDYKPGALALAFDSRTPTFRHERYPAYKAQRDEAPPDLLEQLPLLFEALKALGWAQLQQDGVEADDFIASGARQLGAAGTGVWIISGDKDLMQLVGGPVRMLRPDRMGSGYKLYGADEVFEDKGVHPRQIQDYLALLGDASDNIPGVKGIGEKTAAKLLQEFGSLQAIYERLDEVASASQRQKLAEGQDKAWLSHWLAGLKDDLPLGNPAGWSLEVRDPGTLKGLFQAWGAKSLVSDLEALVGGAVTAKAAGTALAAPGSSAVPGPGGAPSPLPDAVPAPLRGRYRLITDLAALDEVLATAKNAGIAAFDLETTSLDPVEARFVGFSLSWAEGEAVYVPLLSPDGPVLPEAAVLERLGPWLASGVQIVGQNLKFDAKVLLARGLTLTAWFDTLVAAWLLDTTQNTYNLEFLAHQYLNYEGALAFDAVVPKGGTFDQVPLDQALAYAAEDADLTFRLYLALLPRLKNLGLERLFFDVEMPVFNLLTRMEWEGIGLNTSELETYSRELELDIRRIEGEARSLAGEDFNLGSPKQLQVILFEKRGLKPTRKTKTGWSTDSDVLEELARVDELPALILRHRLLTKLKGTYVDTLPALVRPSTGRIHTHFLPWGTATGRLSSKDPNLQNIPIKDEEGRRIRRAFTARPGHVFISADYSQIELVVLAHLSGDPGLGDAFRQGKDIHRRTAALILGIDEEAVTPDLRRAAKAINFGLLYGMSAFRLANELGISRTQADGFLKAYFQGFPKIREFIDATVAQAEKDGFVSTILGRRRPLPLINSRNKTEKLGAERIAINTPVQGSAADIVKLAMLRVDAALGAEGLKTRLLLQVHDELLTEAPEAEADQVAALLKREMEAALPLSVPLRVSVEVGRRWGDLH